MYAARVTSSLDDRRTLCHMTRWLPRRTDIVTALVLLVLVQAELWYTAPEGRLPVMALGLAVGCAAVAFRRIAPLPATSVSLAGVMVVPAVADVDAATTLGWLVAALLMAASLGYHGTRPLIGITSILALVSIAVVIDQGLRLGDVLFGWILAGGAWLAGRGVAAQAASAQLARERAVLIEDRSVMLARSAVIDERLRIAREMHDVVAHSLSVITLHVAGVRRLLRPDQTAERAALGSAEDAGREAMRELHRILDVLRDEPGSDRGPAPSLRRLEEIVDLARGTGLDVRVSTAGSPRELPPGLDMTAFRIVQEALTNVRRHAMAGQVMVTLDYRPDGLTIAIRDDGVGLPNMPATGHGVTGMRERAAAYGGTVSLSPADGGGALVRAWLPLSHATDEKTIAT